MKYIDLLRFFYNFFIKYYIKNKNNKQKKILPETSISANSTCHASASTKINGKFREDRK